MDVIRQQVRRANRRLLWNQLVHAVTWSLFAALLLALVAITLPKIWALGLPSGRIWSIAWIVGAMTFGISTGVLWVVLRRRGELDAAIEIDLRYGLKERVSSAFALTSDELATEAGQALLEDAQRRVARIDVREHFRPQLSWHPLLPVITAAIVFLVAFLVQDATRDSAVAAGAANANNQEQVRKSIAELKKRLAQQKKKADAVGLKEADTLITRMERAVDELSKKDIDRKKTLVKLNNLSKELEERRKEVEGSQKTRDMLKQLQPASRGPAERIANALKKGDMELAMQELKKLSDKLQSDELTEQEKAELAKQLQQLGKELEKMLGVRQELAQKQRELQERIEQLKKEGKLAEAGGLQRQLDQVQKQLDALDQQSPQMQQLQQLANKMGDCANCLKAGDGKQAAQQLEQLANSLQQMQSQLENLQTLDEMMNEIADAKNSMSCDKCGGEGCEACQGGAQAMMGGDMFSEKPGRGMGPGQGMGERPETETETGGYRTRVGADPRQGEAIRVGDASGPNVAGKSREQIKAEIAGALSEDPDPVNQQQLPKREREQTREYFELLEKGG